MIEQEVYEAVKDIAFGQAKASQEILSEGDSPQKTAELALNVLGYADVLLDSSHKLHDGPPLACRVGCSYCCHLPVEASAPEVLAVSERLRSSLSAAEIEELHKVIDRYIDSTDGMTMDKRQLTSVPCPLLRDGQCSVYEVRPIACRTWHSTDAEGCRQFCEDTSESNRSKVNTFAIATSAQVKVGLAAALKSARLEYRPLDFVRALRTALSDPSLAESWRSKPRAFESVVLAKVHPGPGHKETERVYATSYRQIVNQPGWK